MKYLNRGDLTVAIHLIKPQLIILTAMLFGLGAAIGRYLGRPILSDRILLGLFIVLLIQVSAQSLTHFFNQPGNRMEIGRKVPLIYGDGLSNISMRMIFYWAAANLTLASTLIAYLLFSGQLPPLATIILIPGAILVIAYGIPPLQLETSGYGELTTSFLWSAGVPAFSYSLLTGELHRLILMSTVPLFGVVFAVQIAIALSKYGEHSKIQHRNLLVRIGWQRAMRLHDVSLVLSFLTLGLAFAFGLPRRVALGSFLVLPLAIVQIWYFNRIRSGAPVRWRILGLNSHAMVGLMAYLELAGYLLS